MAKLHKQTIIELQYRIGRELFYKLGGGSKAKSSRSILYIRGYKRAADVVASVLRKAAGDG